MKLSDSIYYNVIKKTDITSKSIDRDITLLYDNNKDTVENIALFSADGDMLLSVPAARMRSDSKISDEK